MKSSIALLCCVLLDCGNYAFAGQTIVRSYRSEVVVQSAPVAVQSHQHVVRTKHRHHRRGVTNTTVETIRNVNQ